MYILIGFSVGGGRNGGGGGGGEMFINIKSCKALSVLLGGGGGLWEEKKCFCTSMQNVLEARL